MTIQRNWQHRVHKKQDKYKLENTEGVIMKSTIQRNWQHRVHKTQGKYLLVNTDGIAKKDNPETLAT